MILSHFLNHMIRVGRLNLVDANGKLHEFSGAPGPEATVRLHDRSLHRKLFLNPNLYLGEAYMDGTLTIEQGTLRNFLGITAQNLEFAQSFPAYGVYEFLSRMFRWTQQYNPVSRAKANAAHHYDLSARFYDLFLDRDRQYSCAYFRHAGDGLEPAQHDKRRHIAAKLLLRPGQRILDIGSGWGGLSLYLAGVAEGQVTGLTLSRKQLQIARQRAVDAGLKTRVRFHLRDYREEKGRYERIVSVGMFEHVGVSYYREFFEQIGALLTDDGVCLLHSIGRMAGPSTTGDWTRKYIFPGGYAPALSEVLPAVEKAGLWVTDIEILRRHYADTLLAWQQRFQANRARAMAMYDERFCRMWEFYLALSEAAFRHGDHVVFQMQLAKDRDAVPVTRDYMAKWEQARRQTEMRPHLSTAARRTIRAKG